METRIQEVFYWGRRCASLLTKGHSSRVRGGTSARPTRAVFTQNHPVGRSEHTTKDSPAGLSILKWRGPGLLWIPKTLELSLTLRDV